MATTKTGNSTHDTKVVVAEAVRQAAATPTAPAATVRTADVTFARAAAMSAIANGITSVAYMTMLRELGQGLYA